MSKARLVITAVVVEGRSVRRGRPRLRGRPGRGCTSWWPATGPRARRRSSRGPGDRKTSPTAIAPTTVELIVAAAQGAGRAGPGRRAGHDRLAPRPPPPGRRCSRATIDRHLTPARPGHPEPQQAAQVVLHPLRRRAAQRDAGRPTSPTTGSPTGSRRRDPVLARRPLPLRPVGHRPPPGHRPDRGRQRSAPPSPTTASPASTLTDNGMVFTTRLSGGQRRPQRLRDTNCAASASPRRTRDPTTPPPAARSNGSSRP